MRLLYAKLTPGNFGDELNAFLWPKLFPGLWSADDSIDFIGIGTILSPLVARSPRMKLVFGAGAGYWRVPRIQANWKVYFVRGPLTASALGLPAQAAITDGAYCLALLDGYAAGGTATGPVVFMPHHKSEADVDWRSLCGDLAWTYVSPASPVDTVLQAMRGAKLIVAEAMHGAIIADHYRIPWVPVRYGFRSLDFKWRDWCASMSMEYRPVDLPPLLDASLAARDRIERLVRKSCGIVGIGKPAWKATPVFRSGSRMRDRALSLLGSISTSNAHLSRDSVLERNQARLSAQVEQLRRQYGDLAATARAALGDEHLAVPQMK